jgi:hypothetical protein
MLHPLEILRLARLFSAANGKALSTVGQAACGNPKIFQRLAAGHGATSRTLERIETYFQAEWPENAAWPSDIQNTHRRRSTSTSTENREPESCA